MTDTTNPLRRVGQTRADSYVPTHDQKTIAKGGRRRRPPRPGYASAQEYVLLCTSGKNAEGRYYAGLHDYTHEPMWMHRVDIELAARMRGPGLASAVRALNRRGYIVERVPV
jgi:hypothetical protein